ncbi:MoxR-like ATPase [Alkalithermobacter thermoalcaliphilus JW-YL-7 = DSM 7308]|uniref:ATPase associated with various cellular activities AAA_3 n=1 Tax=Alkalithermobacter thermoalcaliphilus JW-YL-7 = DSM 7308 TaxID=1121328 RepID=A0A150FUG1_CLOPD|nr:ATPase associated with various cellular activities AAA_3 [[Clostridium] paradoxum JW-YL-7 = DSM 7308]SHL17908.1 MoxR-like ATPase [[Clostridium] paradoxum JW-YL-7 = DSM 7308]
MSVFKLIKENVSKVIVGKDDIIDLILVSLISGGHVLLEDVPGVGKTTLAKTLAGLIDCNFKRIQFTPDLLPSDLAGINFFNQKTCDFEFRKGPIFTNILLADELNRATPRTQSSLLECMEERQVTVDGKTYNLDKLFMVIATQNPIDTYGTFVLPQAQLDRFFMKIKMGYPNKTEEYRILELSRGEQKKDIKPICNKSDIINMQLEFENVFLSEDITNYILEIISSTRNHELIELGVSPRGTIALYKACKAYAYINERNYVIPDDVIYLSKYVLSHRIQTKKHKSIDEFALIEDIVSKIPAPVETI